LVFGANDTVVLLGKPWDTSKFIGCLQAQKLKQDFRVVNLVYDLIPSFLPQVFGKPLPRDYTCYMFEALSLSDQVLAISESTKKDVARFCELENLKQPATSVIRLGDRPTQEDTGATPNQRLVGKDFILCVGTVEVRKNHALLYAAYKQGCRQGLKLPKLVIVGGKGWYTGDITYQIQNDPELKDLVEIEHHVDDRQLKWLYQNCLFTVFASVYEGWGLPIAESLGYGKVAIASDSSSMPEIASDLIDYFSPYDASGCLKLITKYQDKATRLKKEAQIKKSYKPTSWDQTYQQVAKLI
jgi:glycosyltransferase involved in cell wall biosynthesis